MRLIDADKLIASLKPEESVWVGLVLAEQVANAETVEAIPIEWIEKNYSWLTMAKEMIKHWREENEIS